MPWLRRLACVALCARGALLAAEDRFEIRLGEHLGLGDLRLLGPRATSQVEFRWPVDWKARPGAELRLRFEHSPSLDGERSFLAVSLNHGVLRSFRLEDANAAKGQLVVPLPPEMLRAENELVITAEQSSRSGAREQLWTVVRAETSLWIPFERGVVNWSLGDLPAPLLRRDSFEPLRLAVVLPTRPSGATLEATARAIAGLVSGVAPTPVTLSFARALKDADAPVLIVGTAGEQPALADLGAPVAEAVTKAGATTGVALLLPEGGPGGRPVVVLTGKGAAAVRNAALGFLRAPRRKASRVLMVPELPEGRPARRRGWRGFIPPSSSFSIDEAGDSRAELAITADLPGRVRIKAPPDARFLPYGHRASLVFETLPGAPTDAKADLEVYWNDVLLREAPMEQKAHARRFSLSMPIPASALRPQNLLTVAWNGRSGAPGPFVALRGDSSSLVLPREYSAELPDLALLRSSFYPFSLRADLSETVIGIPGSEEAIPALFELAALLGRLSPSDTFLFRVASLTEAAASADDAILLEVGDEPSPLSLPNVTALPRGPSLVRLPLVQEIARADGRYTLRLRASTPALLRTTAHALGEPFVLERLSGDTAFLASEGPVTFTLGPRRRVAEISYLTRLQAWLRSYWLALPLILTATSSLLFMGLRLVLEYYRSRPEMRSRRGPGGASPADAGG